MQWLPLDDIRDGMVLAEDILDAHGQPLLTAGQPLSAERREWMRTRGVDRVAVRTPEDDAGSAGPSEYRAYAPPPTDDADFAARQAEIRARLERLRFMFVEHRDDPRMVDLYRIACRVAREGMP